MQPRIGKARDLPPPFACCPACFAPNLECGRGFQSFLRSWSGLAPGVKARPSGGHWRAPPRLGSRKMPWFLFSGQDILMPLLFIQDQGFFCKNIFFSNPVQWHPILIMFIFCKHNTNSSVTSANNVAATLTAANTKHSIIRHCIIFILQTYSD